MERLYQLLSQQNLQQQPKKMSRQIFYDLILAKSLNNGIGVNGSIPWKLPSELKMFKKITTSGPNINTLIMGRKTYQSIGSKPLPQRLNIVISKNQQIPENDHLKQAKNFQEALKLSKQLNSSGKIFIIGGQKIFQEALPGCRYIYETLINKDFQCDTFAPKNDYPNYFVSKTMKQKDICFDYRIFYNPKIISNPSPDTFGLPAHQQYQYINAIQNIIEKGQERIDRTKTGTKAIFGGMMKYSLHDTFPLLTHKKVFWRGVAQELLWFIKGSTDARILENKKINIWAGNSSKEYLNSIGIDRQAGDLGPVYGYQWRHWNAPYTTMHEDYTNKGIDQLSWIINQIKTNPASRRLILTAWNPSQLKEMALPPCHLLSQFYVTNDGRLSCILYQRSCDMGLGVPFNIASYSLLTCLMAQVTGLKRGQFVHMLADMHVYSDHIESLKGLKNLVPYPFPTLQIDPSIKSIDDFKYEHLQIENYRSHKKIQMKMSV